MEKHTPIAVQRRNFQTYSIKVLKNINTLTQELHIQESGLVEKIMIYNCFHYNSI